MALGNIPAAFRSKIVTADCELVAGGGLGDPPADILESEELYGYDVGGGTRHWLARIQAETQPVLLLVLLSPGSMATIGYEALEAFAARYPRQPIYVASILDHKTLVRDRFPQIRRLYMGSGLVRGMILTDNRRSSER